MIRHQGKRYIYKYQDRLFTVKSLASLLMVNEHTLCNRLKKETEINGQPIVCVGTGTFEMCYEVYDRTGHKVVRGKGSTCGKKVFCTEQNIHTAAITNRIIANEYRVICVGRKHFVEDEEIDYE